MRDPKLAAFGIILFLAGAGCGVKANLASRERDQFDAQHQAPPAPAPLPSDEEVRDALSKHMDLNQTVQTWWIITIIVAGAGLLLTAAAIPGKPRTPPPRV